MQKITPFLWFDNNAEEAVNFYLSVFKNSKLGSVQRYGAAGPGKEGDVMSVTFEIDGEEFYTLNGGSNYKFSPATSFFIDCKTQEEVDHLWESLSEGGQQMACGWLTDKFGVTWQIVPTVLTKLLHDTDIERSQRVMRVMMQMTKLDGNLLQKAYDGE